MAQPLHFLLRRSRCRITLSKALHMKALRRCACRPRQVWASAVSPVMRALDRVVAGVAPTDIPVLLVGDSGTGKLVLATEIHRLSGQANKPFIHISCASLTVPALAGWLSPNHAGER